MTNKQVADVLSAIGTLLEILDDNPFRANAYHNAARHIEGMSESLEDLARKQSLEIIPGIGPKLADKIAQIAMTGRSEYLEKLKTEVPPGLMDLLKIPGLGPKRVRTFWKELGVTNLQDLEAACLSNKISGRKGMGANLQNKIQQGILQVKRYMDSYLLGEAFPIARELEAHLRQSFHVKHVSMAGSARRGQSTVRDIDLVAATTDPHAVAQHLKIHRLVDSVRQEGSVIFAKLLSGPPIEVFCVPVERFAGALFYFTGSKSYIDELNKILKTRGAQVTPGGIAERDFESEAAIFDFLDLQETPPELRDMPLGLLLGQTRSIPRMIEIGDLTGVLHVHSTWSDGVNALEEMVATACTMGFKYIGISDHSKTARYANGLDEARLEKQWEEIAKVQATYPGIRILRGTECDILPDGSMDFSDSILKQFDFVIGSVHSSFTQSEAEITARVARALENPYVDILGHATGRLLLGREGYAINLDTVLLAAKENRKVVELNANPHRLDPDPPWVRKAAEMGIPLSINPDAHNRTGLADVQFGTLAARRSGLTREQVFNARPPEEVYAHFKSHR